MSGLKNIFSYLFPFLNYQYKFSRVLYIYKRNHYYFDNRLVFWPKKLLLYKVANSDVNEAKMQNRDTSLMFFYLGFLSQTLTIHKTAREERGTFFFFANISTRSQTFRQLLKVLHLRWVASIFHCSQYNCQTLAKLDLSTSRNYHSIEC